MARPVGVLESPLDLDYFAECGIGNLAADALRERMGAEVAIICSGQFHQGLPAGTLTLGQLDRACFSSANPCVTDVRGAQILAALERGLDPAICRTEVRGFRGAPVGIPQISGMVVEYDPGAETGHRVRRVVVQDRSLDVDRSYRIAHTDAETIAQAGCLVLDEGQTTEYEVPTIVREVIEDYVHRHSPVVRPPGGRWLSTPRSQTGG
jgi:2',3'-cyclic-nucleotide 2'-phosphodiesterase (5'-nucleotidase family)